MASWRGGLAVPRVRHACSACAKGPFCPGLGERGHLSWRWEVLLMTVDPGSAQRTVATPPPKAPASAPLPEICSAEEWEAFKQQDLDRARRVHDQLRELSGGRLGWASVLGIADADLLAMSRAAAASMDQGRFDEAERTFRSLTLLDPFVPWFWLALGEACLRESKIAEALDAFSRCIDEATASSPPTEHARTAMLRRGTIYAQYGKDVNAFEDLIRVVTMDNDRVFDGEKAMLAIEKLANEGRLSPDQLARVPQRSSEQRP